VTASPLSGEALVACVTGFFETSGTRAASRLRRPGRPGHERRDRRASAWRNMDRGRKYQSAYLGSV